LVRPKAILLLAGCAADAARLPVTLTRGTAHVRSQYWTWQCKWQATTLASIDQVSSVSGSLATVSVDVSAVVASQGISQLLSFLASALNNR
jgi:membrane-bound inhibitor of C-type lysozyme